MTSTISHTRLFQVSLAIDWPVSVIPTEKYTVEPWLSVGMQGIGNRRDQRL